MYLHHSGPRTLWGRLTSGWRSERNRWALVLMITFKQKFPLPILESAFFFFFLLNQILIVNHGEENTNITSQHFINVWIFKFLTAMALSICLTIVLFQFACCRSNGWRCEHILPRWRWQPWRGGSWNHDSRSVQLFKILLHLCLTLVFLDNSLQMSNTCM